MFLGCSVFGLVEVVNVMELCLSSSCCSICSAFSSIVQIVSGCSGCCSVAEVVLCGFLKV